MTAAGVLDGQRLRTAARCLALDGIAAAAVRALDERGIAGIVLKGPALAHRLHPEDPGARPYRDVDLLVAPGTFAAAEDTLAALGFRPALPGARPDDLLWHEREWRAPGPAGLVIDLHRGFAGVEDAGHFWTALWSTADRLPVGGSVVPIPGPAGAALVLALHAAAPGASSQPAADLVRALEVLPEGTWRDAAALARESRSAAAFAVGLRLVPDGADLARRLGLPVAAPSVTWLRARPHDPTAFALAKLAAVPTVRGRLRLLALRLLPSPASMRSGSALAGRGPLGLVGAYAGRLVRLAVGTPRGFVDLRTAAAAARGDDRAPRLRRSSARRRLLRVTRAVRCCDLPGIRAGVWAWRACRQVRRELPAAGLAGVTVAPAPAAGRHGDRVVAAVLRRLGASCLEGSLVRQRWYASHGIARELVIGVSAPGAGFHAHAWLAGETSAEHHQLVEILRRPPNPPDDPPAARPGRHRSAVPR